ncbi:MAG TPA: hypothetical protein VMH79_00005, partial [Thermoanaerobaculia bacterium]|nr:hypothetical protein [Thermoanaerobaculia bacterium]
MTRFAVRLALPLTLGLVSLAPPVARAQARGPETIHGRWLVDFRRDGSLDLTLKRRSSSGSDNWS